MVDLPTIDECRAFFAALNDERAALGLGPLDPGELDYDGACPTDSEDCLSARNCYGPAGYWVGSKDAWSGDIRRPIPCAILRVTDHFDEHGKTRKLRARLAEAGIVA